MLKAIHAQESKKAAREKARTVVAELKAMKLKEAANKLENGIEETLSYYDFPSEHWIKIRTNNVIERLSLEIRRRTRVVGCFPDGNSALMLVCARLRHVAGTQWGNKKYMSMKHLDAMSDPLMVASWNGQPINPDGPYSWLYRFCKREGLPFRGLHSFRHAFATAMIVNGQIDVKTVSSILGHSEISTTLNIYTHAIHSANAQAMDFVADVLRGGQNNDKNKDNGQKIAPQKA